LLSRRGRRSPANASGLRTHRDSISSRFDCRYAAARGRGALKHHWKTTHLAQRYRLCADARGHRLGDTDVIGHFHTLGLEGGGTYTGR
jgi:hypothetical protein